jgi:hypothetical protein
MIFAGIGLLIGPSLVEKVALAILGVKVDANITQNDPIYGFGLVLWASVYHMVMSRLTDITVALKDKEKNEARRALIDECRRYLDDGKFSRREFAETVLYSRLRPYFGAELIKDIERDPNHITVRTGTARGGGVDNYKSEILDRLVELEKQWNLL